MSQTRITLRPPPNVEFVQGYPGIPPAGHERPHAEVRGTIELRLGAQGVKAKWVRVELRKVETLPGGGQANTFYDFVGPSPVKVWEAQEEWAWLKTQDFPFSIRIPESIPPSIALEKNAGIKYELIATLCMKGKSGLLRRSTTPTLSTTQQIVIDKHELHSTWPVYAQPDSRHVVEGSLTLTIDRTHTCYGPGDRVAVLATFRNDGVTTAALRAFEFMVKETIIFRAGPQVSGKKGAPQVKVSVIGEQKVPVNASVYGGQQHKVELSCIIPQTHSSTTVNAARHIDIAYSINVKAVLGAGKPLLMDLPVTISNWPRSMSVEAVRRIGPSPNLSLTAPSHLPSSIQRAQPSDISQLTRAGMLQPNPAGSSTAVDAFATPDRGAGPSSQVRPFSIAERVGQRSDGVLGPPQINTIPSGYSGDMKQGAQAGIGRPGFDEFGYPVGPVPNAQPATIPGYPRGNTNDFSSVDASAADPRRARPMINTATSNRLTIVNGGAESDDTHGQAASSSSRYLTAAEEKQRLQNSLANIPESSAAAPQTNPTPVVSPPASVNQRRGGYLSAEEEKQRLYERAKLDAQRVQASMGNPISSISVQPIQRPEPTVTESVRSRPSASASGGSTSRVAGKSTAWPTAEEEKLRLYNSAISAVRRTQGVSESSTAGQAVDGGDGESNQSSDSARGSQGPAIGSQVPSQFTQRQTSFTASASNGASAASPRHTPSYSRSMEVKPAESVGALLYSHAMANVNRTGSMQAGMPQASSSKPNNNAPSARNFPSAEEEKAALRYYEAKRAVDRHQNTSHQESSTSISQVPPEEPIAYDALYPGAQSGSRSGPSQVVDGMAAGGSSYREMNDVQAYESATRSRTNTIGSPDNGSGSFLPIATPPDSPPAAANSFNFNSAISEKERLRRKYEAEDAAATAGAGPLPPSPPQFATSSSASPPLYGSPPRAQPVPPPNFSGSRPLTAAEEKAKLRAQYEAEDAAANGYGGAGPSGSGNYPSPPPTAGPSYAYAGPSSSSSLSRSASLAYAEHAAPKVDFVPPPPPPPLAPKPPVEYIQETQEEDARSQAEEHNFGSIDATLSGSGERWNTADDSRMDFGLSFRPFSPFDVSLGFDNVGKNSKEAPNHTQSFPPPLPPKVPVSD